MKSTNRRPIKASDRFFIQRLMGFKPNRIWNTIELNPRQLYATRHEKGDGKTLRGR
jgi:hypothetical protein